MTIKEMEQRSGMTRANIRFYESEGLLIPARDKNGYRNYSDADLETLRKIRLLRSLHIPLDDIRALIRGDRRLSDVLGTHMTELENSRSELDRCRDVCGLMCRDRAEYATLDAAHYLNELEAVSGSVPAELETDTLPKVTAPWKRYFARLIDSWIYSLILDAFLCLVWHNNSAEFHLGVSIFTWLVGMGLMILLEPAMLSSAGTTPGKFIFGLSVTAQDGSPLTWSEAWSRTWLVLHRGFGFYIPVYHLIRLYSSYKSCVKEEYLEWEENTVLILKKRPNPLLAFMLVLAFLLSSGSELLLNEAASLPPNRGSLSVAEYCENYNMLQKFYGVNRPVNTPDQYFYNTYAKPMLLDENGQWQELPNYSQSYDETFSELPQLIFDGNEKDITGVSFSLSYNNENVTVMPYDDFMALAALSLICAQDDYNFVTSPPQSIYGRIKSAAETFSSFNVTCGDVTAQCEVEFDGYEFSDTGTMLLPEYGAEPSYRMEFSVRKN